MKKLSSLFLALTMVLGMATTAFAAETTDTNKATANEESSNKADIEVTGKYLTQLDSDEIISVDVAWEDMHFIYYASQQGTWNPQEHTYDGETGAKWNKTTSNITVTNHSNAEVTTSLSYTPSVTTVMGSLSASSLTLESAAQEAYMGDNANKAPTGNSTFTISGSMNSTSSTDLGTITVSIEKGDGIDWNVVSTYEDLKTALTAGGNIKLGADIYHEGSSSDYLATYSNFNLDLNGKALTVQCLMSYADTASVSNGTLTATDGKIVAARGNKFTIDNCTLNGANYYALYVSSGTVILKNSTVNNGLYVGEGTLTATENVTVNIGGNYQKIKVNSGSATFGFDPTGKVSNSTITDNGDGTWTVTAQ